MCLYREHRWVPLSWWLIALALVVLLGSELWAGFGLLVAAAVYAVLGGVCAAMLLSLGRGTVVVKDGTLTVGREVLSLAGTGEVSSLDEKQTVALRGPSADPAARLLTRPHLRRAVYIQVNDLAAATPYWLVGTRHPDKLAAALRQCTAAGGVTGDAACHHETIGKPGQAR